MENARKRKFSIKLFVIGFSFILAFCLPDSVFATRCGSPDTRYLMECEGGNCSRGYKIEAKFVNAISVCAAKTQIIELRRDEIETFNSCFARTTIPTGTVELLIPFRCFDACEICLERTTATQLSRNFELDKFANEVERNLFIEQVQFYLYEGFSLIIRFFPLLVGLSIPFVVNKKITSKQFWQRAILLWLIQGILTLTMWWYEIISDTWTAIAIDISFFAMFVELVFIVRLAYLRDKNQRVKAS